MIGSLLLPTFSKSHHHGAGFHGSPVEANRRRELRSWRQKGGMYSTLTSTSISLPSSSILISQVAGGSTAASDLTRVGDMPSTSTLCFAQNSHILSGVG